MPKALKTCSVPGCAELVAAGRCPTHTKAADQARGTAAQRGYDTRWANTARAYLREHPICECQPGCYQLATEVDHIDGLGPNGPRGHDPANLRALSKSHHSRRTAQDQPGGWNAR